MLPKDLFKKPMNTLESAYEKLTKTAAPDVPSEMCTSCPGCRAMLFTSDLSENDNVCPKCGHHFRINARQRISIIADEGSFQELSGDLRSKNVIGFPNYDKKLKHAYLDSAGKAQRRLPPPKTAFSGIVNKRMVSVGSRIIYVMRRLYQDGQLPYKELFAPCDRSELVATFLAMLELMKSRRITVSDDNTMVYFNRTHFTGEEAPAEEPGGKEEG